MAAAQTKVYINGLKHLDDDVDWATDTIKASLHVSALTPAQGTDEFFSTLTAEVAVVSTTLAAAASAAATTISLTASIGVGNAVAIGTGGTRDVRTITAITGAGPYTATVAALTNAHSSGEAVVSGSGYTAGGVTLASKTKVVNGLILAYRAGTLTWTAATGLVLGARWLVYRKDTGTASTSPVLAYTLLDSAPADLIADGAALTVNPDATDGCFKITAS